MIECLGRPFSGGSAPSPPPWKTDNMLHHVPCKIHGRREKVDTANSCKRTRPLLQNTADMYNCGSWGSFCSTPLPKRRGLCIVSTATNHLLVSFVSGIRNRHNMLSARPVSPVLEQECAQGQSGLHRCKFLFALISHALLDTTFHT